MIGPAPLKRKMRVREPETIRSATHKAFVRKQSCILRGKGSHKCEGPIQCCHYRMANGGGMGLKTGDQHTWPGCYGAHRLQHDIGEPEFARRFGLDLRAECDFYARISPDPRIREAVNGD